LAEVVAGSGDHVYKQAGPCVNLFISLITVFFDMLVAFLMKVALMF